MVHPTCAPARPPNALPAGENPLRKPEDERRPSLALQASAQINAAREAYHAITCVCDLLEAQRARMREGDVTRVQVEALVAVVNGEFERRAQLAYATIASMTVEVQHGTDPTRHFGNMNCA